METLGPRRGYPDSSCRFAGVKNAAAMDTAHETPDPHTMSSSTIIFSRLGGFDQAQWMSI